ncbi:MAG: stage V sporulation protein AC [Deltaproteobacteria bacterium]
MNSPFTKKEYQDYVKKKSPNTSLLKNIVWAFVVGGIICTIGEIFRNLYELNGFNNDTVSNLTSITMIFIGSFLTGINIYDEIGKRAGAGSIVPITGFANSIVSPAMEYKSEGYITGVGAKMFVIAGPVLVFGIASSVVIGILFYIFK